MSWIHPSILFLTFGFSMMWGILFGGIFSEQKYEYIGALLVGGVFFYFLFRSLRLHILLGILGLLIGYLWLEHAEGIHISRREELARLTGAFTLTLPIEGEVTTTLSRRANMVRYEFLLEKVGTHSVTDTIHIFISVPENLTLAPGDRIGFTGKIKALQSNESFDYEKYGWIHRTYGETNAFTFARLKADEGSLRAYIALIRASLREKIRMIFPPDTDALALGMIIGDTHLFTDAMNSNFSRSGLSHLVAVSGSNIALVIVFLSIFLRYLPLRRWSRVTIILTGILVYCLIVGWNIPAIRAGFMGMIGYLVLVSGKKISIIPFLLLTALLFLIREPFTLAFDVSFQLSFIAVWGLILLHDPIGRLLRYVPNTFLLRDALIVILSASLITMPIIFANFQTIALFGIIANLLVAPFIAIGTILGIVSMGVTFISPLLGHILGYIPFGIFTFILGVSDWIGAYSGAVISAENIAPYDTLILIGTFFYVTWMSFEHVYDTHFSREKDA